MKSKCISKGTPDLMGQISTGTYPETPMKNKPSVDSSMMADSSPMGGGAPAAPAKKENMVDGTFSKISMDFSYSKTPKRS
jgi:hypothetical protein